MGHLSKLILSFQAVIILSIGPIHGQFSNRGPDGKYSVQSNFHYSKDSTISHLKLSRELFLLSGVMITYGIISLNDEEFKDWNETIRDEIWNKHPHSTTNVEDYLQWLPAASVYGLNLAGVKGKNNLRDRSFIYGISMLIMSTSVWATKKISNETRPDGSDPYSFPSGHTANAFCGAEFLRQEYKGKSAWYGIGGYAAAFVTAYLRMYNDKHWLGDVVAGAGIGILSTNLGYTIYPVIKKWLFGKSEMNTILFPQHNAQSWGLAAIHFF